MWKYQNFSANQMLFEINFLWFWNFKHGNFDYFIGFDFEIFGETWQFLQRWNFPKSNFKASENFKMVICHTLDLPKMISHKIWVTEKFLLCEVFIWMTLFSRKDIGFGRAAVFLSVTQIGILANRTTMEMKIVCISPEVVIRNG